MLPLLNRAYFTLIKPRTRNQFQLQLIYVILHLTQSPQIPASQLWYRPVSIRPESCIHFRFFIIVLLLTHNFELGPML